MSNTINYIYFAITISFVTILFSLYKIGKLIQQGFSKSRNLKLVILFLFIVFTLDAISIIVGSSLLLLDLDEERRIWDFLSKIMGALSIIAALAMALNALQILPLVLETKTASSSHTSHIPKSVFRALYALLMVTFVASMVAVVTGPQPIGMLCPVVSIVTGISTYIIMYLKYSEKRIVDIENIEKIDSSKTTTSLFRTALGTMEPGKSACIWQVLNTIAGTVLLSVSLSRPTKDRGLEHTLDSLPWLFYAFANSSALFIINKLAANPAKNVKKAAAPKMTTSFFLKSVSF